MSQLLERLLEKFSPPLEPALIIALSSDFDHDTEESAEQDIESKLDDILTQLINEQQEQGTQTEEQQLVTIQTDHHSSQKLINQVHAILPDLSETTIYHAISDAPEPKNLEQIIDILLAPTPPPPPPATVESAPRSDKKAKNKRKKKFDTIHLNDVLQRETHKRLIEQAGQHREKTSINNDWAIGDSQISYLADLLGIEIGKINSIYHRKNCNLVLTLEELLRISESQKRLDGSKDQDWFDRLQLQLDFLRTTLLTEDDQVLTRLLIVTNLNPGRALDLWIFLDDLHARYGTLPFNQFISNPSSASSYPSSSSSSSTTASLPTQSKANSLISSSSTSAAVASSAAAPSRPFSVNVQPTTRPQYSSREIENSVMILRSRREYLNQKSRSSRQLIANSHVVSHNKQAIQNSIAMIYAEGSRRLNEKIQDWELLLARKTVQERQRMRNDSLSIDLHGLTKSQALVISSDYLQTWWSNHSCLFFTFSHFFTSLLSYAQLIRLFLFFAWGASRLSQ
jgi:hypothetical protein